MLGGLCLAGPGHTPPASAASLSDKAPQLTRGQGPRPLRPWRAASTPAPCTIRNRPDEKAKDPLSSPRTATSTQCHPPCQACRLQLTVDPGLTESLPRKRVVTLGTGLRLAIAVRHRAPQNQLPVSPALATVRTLHKYPNLYDLIMFNFPLA